MASFAWRNGFSPVDFSRVCLRRDVQELLEHPRKKKISRWSPSGAKNSGFRADTWGSYINQRLLGVCAIYSHCKWTDPSCLRTCLYLKQEEEPSPCNRLGSKPYESKHWRKALTADQSDPVASSQQTISNLMCKSDAHDSRLGYDHRAFLLKTRGIHWSIRSFPVQTEVSP